MRLSLRFTLAAGLLVLAALASAGGANDAAKKADKARKELLRSSKSLKQSPTSVLVRFKRGTSEAVKENARNGLKAVRLAKFRLVEGLELIDTPMGYAKAIEALRKNPNVLYAEPDRVRRVSVIPNDPSFGALWGLNQANNFDIDAPEAWDTFTGSPSVVIADIDTGVQVDHPDLADNMWVNQGEIAGNGLDDDGNGYVDDVNGYDFYSNDSNPNDEHGHGTHTSGTFGAEGGNGIGITGVNWQCKIMALRFLGPDGSGFSSDAIRALEYCTLMGVKVSNNSYGGDGWEQSFYDAIEATKQVGHLFVAAAGNYQIDNDLNPFYPASYENDNVISVAAVDENGNKAWFSHWGANSVDLGAPGTNTYSTIPGGGYGYASGTSMATPHVAGVVGLIYGRFPNMTYEMVKAKVLNSVRPIASMSGITVTGGLLNAATAMIDTEPQLTVNGPAAGVTFIEGEPINFDATAFDAEDGDISTSIEWSSNVSGSIGNGGSVTSSDLAAGAHNITVTVTDSASHTVSTTFTITVENTAPVVQVTSPTSGSTVGYGDSVTFTGTASDAQDGDISENIQWYSDIQGYLGSGATFSRADLMLGTHHISATASDQGNLGNTQVITITVVNTAPIVVISIPSSGSSFYEGTSVTFGGSAYDSIDGTLSDSLVWTSSIDGNLGTGAFISVSGLSAGEHVITASATDNGGLTGSTTITITVLVSPPAAPSGVTAVKASKGTARISWLDNSNNETGFTVEREQQVKGKWANTTTVATTGANVTTITNSPGGGTFRYRVRSFNSGGTSAWSAWIQVKV